MQAASGGHAKDHRTANQREICCILCRMRATEHAPRDPFRVLEHRHGPTDRQRALSVAPSLANGRSEAITFWFEPSQSSMLARRHRATHRSAESVDEEGPQRPFAYNTSPRALM